MQRLFTWLPLAREAIKLKNSFLIMPQRIGIYGGTFNPVHNAHLIMAEHFCEEMSLDKCFFVPANISPFKTNNSSALSISSENRLEMLQIAIEENPKFVVDTFEIEKPDVSYTYLTVDYFREKYQNDGLFLLLGSDQALFFNKWKNWEQILSKVQICIAARNKLSKLKIKEINKLLTYKQKKPFFLNSPLIDISSTDIRNKIKTKKSIKYLVPDKLIDFIEKKRLYQSIFDA